MLRRASLITISSNKTLRKKLDLLTKGKITKQAELNAGYSYCISPIKEFETFKPLESSDIHSHTSSPTPLKPWTAHLVHSFLSLHLPQYLFPDHSHPQRNSLRQNSSQQTRLTFTWCSRWTLDLHHRRFKHLKSKLQKILLVKSMFQ